MFTGGIDPVSVNVMCDDLDSFIFSFHFRVQLVISSKFLQIRGGLRRVWVGCEYGHVVREGAENCFV